MDESNSLYGIEGRITGFQSFEHAAEDMVLAASFNDAGTRIVLCSADHKIRVYNIGAIDEYTIVDQWRGHDAEVLDASIVLLLPRTRVAKEIAILRSNGLLLAWVNSLQLSAAIISSNCGERTHRKDSRVADASGVFSRSRRPTVSPTTPLALRLSGTIFSFL